MSFRKVLKTFGEEVIKKAKNMDTEDMLIGGAFYGAVGGAGYLGATNGFKVAQQGFRHEWKDDDMPSRLLKSTALGTAFGLGYAVPGALGGGVAGLGVAAMLRLAGLGITFFAPLKAADTVKKAALLAMPAGDEVVSRFKK